jgi:uncharacterized protein (DUF2141 family)
MKKSVSVRKVVMGISLLFIAAAFYRCANVMAPTGGPRDLTPPKVVESSPPNHSVHFTSRQFSLTFNEYIQLDKINEQLLVSPPMVHMPEFHVKGKTLTVSFTEALKPNTTYSVFFGDAIQDITENNPLHNFTYVFSTGSRIDSMSLRGKVLNAIDLKPEEGVFVMLYKNNNDTLSLDSLPLFVKPYYLSKTNKQGVFMFSGLADTSYMIFALKDMNGSLTFDQPTEKIAFLDSLVRPQYRPVPHIDSAVLDTLTRGMPSDSTQMVADSLWRRADSLANQKLVSYNLFLFSQPDSVLKFMKAKLIRPNTVQFVFNLPAKDVSFQSLNYHPDTVWHKDEWSKSGDTLLWFLHLPHPDTLHLMLFHGGDTLDSLTLRVIPRQKINRRRKKDTLHKKKIYLSWSASLAGTVKPGQKEVITFAQPVAKVISDSILLVQDGDSVFHPDFVFLDSLHRKIFFPFNIKDEGSYRLVLPDSSVIDWNGFFNKKIDLSLHAKALKAYGSMNVTLRASHPGNYIFEILNQNNKPVETRFFSGSTVLHFLRLNPGTYRYKLIFDRNGNKKWDSGNYFKKQLPEKVLYFQNKIQLRANWEVNETWNF